MSELIFINTLVSVVLFLICVVFDIEFVHKIMNNYAKKINTFVFVVTALFFFQQFLFVLWLLDKKEKRDEAIAEKEEHQNMRDYIANNWREHDELNHRLIYQCPHPDGYIVYDNHIEDYTLMSLEAIINIGNKTEKQRRISEQREHLRNYVEAYKSI